MNHVPSPLFGKLFAVTIPVLIIVECLSLLGHVFPTVRLIAFFLIVLAFAVICIRSRFAAFLVVLAEIIIGSWGYLFEISIGGTRVSIRLALFIILMAAWLLERLLTQSLPRWRNPATYAWLGLLGAVVLGVAVALWQGNPLGNIFYDANAYLFLGLWLVAITVITGWHRVWQVLQVIFAAVTVMAVKTYFLVVYFAHQTDESAIRLVYTWVRDTRIGEISPVVEHYYRIFFASHLWGVVAFIIAWCLLWLVPRVWSRRDRWLLGLMLFLSSGITLISFSRSYWLALAITAVVFLVAMRWKLRYSFRQISKALGMLVGVAVAQLLFITFLVNVHWPGTGGPGVSTAELVRSRIANTEEAALRSRFQLLRPLLSASLERPVTGSGFGTEVTYQTLDPRSQQVNGGSYTTYSFEWGYLDVWLKMGTIGLLAVLMFFYVIGRSGWQRVGGVPLSVPVALQWAWLASLCFLLATHATTPYINHPIGIMLVIVAAAVFLLSPAEKEATPVSP